MAVEPPDIGRTLQSISGDSASSDEAVTAILLRAGEAQRLARGFQYPAPGDRRTLCESLDVLAAAAGRDSELSARVWTVRRAWTSLAEETIRDEYSRLFIAGGGCSLNETAYTGAALTTAAELADIQGFYRAFGFERSAHHPEMADHLVSELEFYAALLVKLAYATLQGWAMEREVTVDAAGRFLEAHLGRWLPALMNRLRALDAAPPYLRSAEAVEAFVAAECRLLGVTPQPLSGATLGGAREPDVLTCPVAGDHAETDGEVKPLSWHARRSPDV